MFLELERAERERAQSCKRWFMTLEYLSALAGQLDASIAHLSDLLSPLSHSPDPVQKYASALRGALISEIPPAFRLAQGHIATSQYCSPYQEVILYDSAQAPQYEEGCWKIVRPESVRAIISVCPGPLTEPQVVDALQALAEVSAVARKASSHPVATVLWAPDAHDWREEDLSHLADLVGMKSPDHLTSHLVFGTQAYAQLRPDLGENQWNLLAESFQQQGLAATVGTNGAVLINAITQHLKTPWSLPGFADQSTTSQATTRAGAMAIPVKGKAGIPAPKQILPVKAAFAGNPVSTLSPAAKAPMATGPSGPAVKEKSQDGFLERTLGRFGKLSRPGKQGGGNGSPRQQHGDKLVHEWVSKGKLDLVTAALESGEVALEAKDRDGNTALHLAAAAGQEAIAKKLLQAGANSNSRNFVYATPLHLAVSGGNDGMIRLLVKHKAELEVRNNRSQTPLHTAAICGEISGARILLEVGADISAQMEKGVMPIHLAAWYGQVSFLQMLIQAGGDLNSANEDGNTPLHFAAFKGQVKVIKALINHGADPSLANEMGDTYLVGLNEGYQGEMIRLLD